LFLLKKKQDRLGQGWRIYHSEVKDAELAHGRAESFLYSGPPFLD
jgi:hypothetical protein